MVIGSEFNGSLCHRSASELKPAQIGRNKPQILANDDELDVVEEVREDTAQEN